MTQLRALLGAFLIACSLLIGGPAAATSILALTVSELVAESSVVVEARVEAQDAYRGPGPAGEGEAIWTRTHLRVLRWHKGGLASEELVITQLGGALGQEQMMIAGAARLQPGQEVVLFADREEGGERLFPTLFGWSVFHIEQPVEGQDLPAAELPVRRHADGLALYLREEGVVRLADADALDVPATLDELRSSIESALNAPAEEAR